MSKPQDKRLAEQMSDAEALMAGIQRLNKVWLTCADVREFCRKATLGRASIHTPDGTLTTRRPGRLRDQKR